MEKHEVTYHVVFPSFSLIPEKQATYLPVGSHRAIGGTLSTLNSDCEAHKGRKIKPYRPYIRAVVFLLDDTKDISVNFKCENDERKSKA